MGRTIDLQDRPDVLNALNQVESDAPDVHLGAIIDLKRIIQENRQTSGLKRVPDKGYHAILETIFRVTKLDLSAYAKKSKNARSTIASRAQKRLSGCASLIRTVVEVGHPKLRYRTVKAIAEHISQSLPTTDSHYCEPLVFNYFKALSGLLEYKAHIEHLDADDWRNLTDFCIESARNINRTTDEHEPSLFGGLPKGNIPHRTRPGRSTTPSIGHEPSRSIGDNPSHRLAYPELQQSSQDIILCLQHLASVPTAPVMDRAELILNVLLDLLHSYPYVSKIQRATFETINSIMSRIITSDTHLSLQTMNTLIPLVRRFWEDRSTVGLREVLLSILLLGELFLPRLLASDNSGDCKASLTALLDVIREQYCTRKLREQLQLEDIDLSDQTAPTERRTPLSLKSGSVRLGVFRAEEPWCLLHISAAIFIALEKDTVSGDIAQDTQELQNPAKRQRVSRPLDELFRLARGIQIAERHYALQVLAFVFELHDFDLENLQTNVELLRPGLSSDDGHVASWTMFAMSSAAGQIAARSETLRPLWCQTWRLVARAITSPSVCRIACQLMAIVLENRLVLYVDVGEVFDGIISSPELNGPSECDGAATRLWAILLTLRHKENLNSDLETPGMILRWLSKRWSPANCRDRHRIAYLAQQASIFGTVRLICVCLGLPLSGPKRKSTFDVGRLSQTRLRVVRDQKLINYLLLNTEAKSDTAPLNSGPEFTIHSYERQFPASRFRLLVGAFMDSLVESASALSHSFFSNENSDINADVAKVIVSLCVIGYALLSHSNLRETQQRHQLLGVLDSLRCDLRRCLLQYEKQKELLIAFCESFGSFLGTIEQLTPGKDLLTDGAITMSKGFDKTFWDECRSSSAGESVLNADDGMDVDYDDREVDSQSSQRKEKYAILTTMHEEVMASSSPDSFRACLAAKVCFMSQIDENSEVQSASPIVQYLTTSLGRQEFVLSKGVVHEILASGILITEEDADTILQYLLEVVAKPYEIERSEVSIGICIDTLAVLANMWTNYDQNDLAEEGGSDLAKNGALLYQWLMNEILGKDVYSPHIHLRAASLFERIIKARPDYTKVLSLPSARTSLFKVLRDGNIEVKYNIGNNIPTIFGLFVLKEHDNILEDVIESLPRDPTWKEGIALRLHVLANLASSWSTLLRRCIYAIFETPGNVPDSLGHAQQCIVHVSKSLGLSDRRDLFKLFVSQISYTWLESYPLKSMPFEIFGYMSLRDLFRDVQNEIVGQVAMRGRDDETALITSELGISFANLLAESFFKVATYCIARDKSNHSSIGSQAAKAEGQIRKVLGADRYKALLTENFADIAALFYTTMDYEDQIGKEFGTHEGYEKAHSTYQEIIANGSSSEELPPNQQPSFKAKYLLTELEHLCYRVDYDHEVMWSPPIYLYVFRKILNSMHPALGPLHACSVLRKIRILVCLAGTSALESYPLEMALHALRPFVTETQCAEEAMGIVRYLIDRGRPHLKTVPSFVLGSAITTLLALKAFFVSPQDSTTQESIFRVTLSKAQDFHDWLIIFLEKYDSPKLSEDSRACFQRIIRAASNVKEVGNARSGTYESELLLETLKDQQPKQKLLVQSSKDSILRSLSISFELPTDYRDDVLGDDEKAAQFVSAVWKTCQRGITEPSYLLWAGRVLGRAYGGKGYIDRELTLETTFDPTPKDLAAKESAVSTYPASTGSRVHLLHLLYNFLAKEERNAVGLAEATLRSIVTDAHRKNDFMECEQALPASLLHALLWNDHHLPKVDTHFSENARFSDLKRCMACKDGRKTKQWIQQICVSLVLAATKDPILSKLPSILWTNEDLAEQSFPFILHLVLLNEANGHRATRQVASEAFRHRFDSCTQKQEEIDATSILLKAILYLRTQPLPHEKVEAERAHWLDLDYHRAAAVATKCSLHKTALLLIEIHFSEQAKAEASTSRRSSVRRQEQKTRDVSSDLLLEIYQNIDEQDAYYGVQQPASLYSVMGQLDYEHAGFKSLSFRGAHYDGQIRQASDGIDGESMVRALNSLDLNGLSQSLLSKVTNKGPESVDAALRNARKLEQWDISAPGSYTSSESTVFRAFQRLNNAIDESHIVAALNKGFIDSVHQLLVKKAVKSSMHSILGTLAVLTEIEEVFTCRGYEQLEEVLARFKARNVWMHSESYDRIDVLISCRETMFSSLSKNSKLQEILKTPQRDARRLESRALLASSEMSRYHGALQNALTTTTYLNQLVEPCKKVDVDISAAAMSESARVLWSQREMTASIRILQNLQNMRTSDPQAYQVSKPELLADLGHQISEARLEKPEEIVKNYLGPAIKELHGVSDGDGAGGVFHEFASFCDQQLQNRDGLEDFNRIQKIRESKEAEIQDLDRMMQSVGSQPKEKENLRNHRTKAKQWFDLDDREFQRLRESRQTFLNQSLENYLLCLKATDKYDDDALRRFSTLWLENFDSPTANAAVSKHIAHVGSRKFAPLMNQWTSRLSDAPGQFQKLLFKLVKRLCVDHPYHSMYQMFTYSKNKAGKDETAVARHTAANNIVKDLKGSTWTTWMAIHHTTLKFVRFAAEKPGGKAGAKIPLRTTDYGRMVEQEVLKYPVPPPTITLELRADCDYSNVPTIARFQSEYTLAGGISAPKIITAIGTDGLKYKQLFKGGNDDLRQDAIMEQVFGAVSSLFKSQRATRQRSLKIRTYKVLPLTPTAGIIEFVPNTVPLHEYLLPAHTRHYPTDFKPSACRKHIQDAQSKSVEDRIRVFRSVCDRFHPVLRHFFTERYLTPDDWFERRLAYTRSTAANSIVGYILGIGDRHGQNILLDEETGEVVHIDLGIALEQGRVLPIPEVVPFRLTRDLVDAMGITGTEGVFRRCCEFALDALRNESYTIQTILDVLRFDPLYSWSASPLRIKRIQDAQMENNTDGGPGAEGVVEGKPRVEEAGEADRALLIVEKKLSQTLSIQATVNELIQTATDERNLAVLFCGWAAYA